MPESRYKYLYERLGDHNFQLLANALLTARFPGFVPLPLRQADGGRDGIVRATASSIIFQMKWSVNGKEKDPVKWLDAAVTGEADNIKRLVREGAKRYVLVTNIPSTGKAETGTFDELNALLDQHAKDYGLDEMTCLWREAIDAMVDGADDGLLWKYADMLAGWELVRYLIAEDRAGQQDSRLRKLVRKVASVQWDEDERVKFSQVDIDRERVADLFIDVHAGKLTARDRRNPDLLSHEHVGGAAEYLLTLTPTTAHDWNTIVRGAPGQGKSTLSQYVSQVHRSAFVPAKLRPQTFPDVAKPLFPVRIDLSDYARWMSGVDVFDTESEAPAKAKKRPAPKAGLEYFLADVMSYASGSPVAPAEVQDLFELVPSLIVLDGLDEVGRPAVRKAVVKEIDNLARRGRTYDIPPRIVVTTRPSTNELPEPSGDYFGVVVLSPLTSDQRNEYLRRWSSVRGIVGAAGRNLRTAYRAKIAEPYLDELAGNPMQLTILLDLLHKHGEATPDQRTTLYDAYVEMLLAREANKHPESVRRHQTELRSIIPFLGWHLHAHSETDRLNSRMSIADLKATIRHYQRTYGNPETVVDELFEAASDRLWALTSKLEGTYEFEVLSLREYFAANFLYRFAGEETKRFDRTEVFRELLRRPYWMNTARFYGGNAEGTGELAVLMDGILDELADDPPPHAVIAGWTMLTDGVFANRPRYARDVLAALCADDHMHILVNALSRREIRPLPALPQPGGAGPDPTWLRLTERLASEPGHPAARLQVRVLRELLNQKNQFASWWTGHVVGSINDPDRLDAWLELAATCEAAAGQTVDLSGVDLRRPLVAQRVLDTGLVPPTGGEFETALLESVWDGLCPNVTSVRSVPAQIAVAFAPEDHITKSETGFPETSDEQRRRRQEALRHLRRERPELARAAAKRKFLKGQKGSTFPWSSTASALFDAVGPSWLASQVAILGAASPMKWGGVRRPDCSAFGRGSHPAALLEQTKSKSRDASWWRLAKEQLNTDTGLGDAERELALAEWCLALWCVAKPTVIVDLYEEWSDVMAALPEPRRRPVVDCALRCSTGGWVSKLPIDLTSSDTAISALLSFRNPTPPPKREAQGSYTPKVLTDYDPLIQVARENVWFKVDEQGVYK